MRAKKSLGQHWLRSGSARQAIIEAAGLSDPTSPRLRGATTTVVEIGPGEGFLTETLLETGVKVVAVEKDDRLIEVLQAKFKKEILDGQLELRHVDILDFDYNLLPKTYSLVANIPYYITGAVIKKFLTSENQPQSMTLLVQKEVAERIAREKKESLLSISVKVYGQPKYIKTVPAGAFAPAPKVDSAILSITNISRQNFENVSEEKFFAILKRGFAHKRKLLKSNLSCSAEVLANCHINEQARAENLTLDQWLCLCKNC
ncbi:MAG: ribosomal RNA small subunit methyltransferase A [Candidatus Vogelbacteria bacterium]|nr:ribosomal RNA small subunit methyltransferase A [Candidatus Vogelbacteria bacterium]